MNAFLVQQLEHGLRITGIPMLARRGVLRERRAMAHNGTPGLLLADADGQIVAWIAEASWRQAPVAPVQRRIDLDGVAPRQANTPWGRANGRLEKLRLNHDQIDLEQAIAAKPIPQQKHDTPKPDRFSPADRHVRLVQRLGQIVDPVPALFADVAAGAALRPLKIGIYDDLLPLLRPGVESLRLEMWLNAWCKSPEYRAAVAQQGAMRHDLNALPVGPVSDQRPKLTKTQKRREQEKRKRARDRAAVDPIAGECWGCWNPRADLVANICADCRGEVDQHADRDAEQHPDQGGRVPDADQQHVERHAAARQAGERFFTGRPCPTHGNTERYVSSGRCVPCALESAARRQPDASAAPDQSHIRVPDLVEVMPWSPPPVDPAQQAEAATWYRDHLAAARVRREATARRRGAKQRSA